MDERDRDWRERDWRRSEAYGRGGEMRRWAEDRSWARSAGDDRAPYEDRGRRSYADENEDYGRRSGLTSGGGAYGAYAVETSGPGVGVPRFSSQDYTGRRYADEAAREDYGYPGQRSLRGEGRAGRRYGGWDDRERYGFERDREPRVSWEGKSLYDRERRWYADERRRRGGYGSERGYGDLHRRESWEERGGEGRYEGPSDFLQRGGERISSSFRGDSATRGRDDGPSRYGANIDREANWEISDRSHRGLGPKGYKRSDERIGEEVHERLTDDAWLDAYDIQVEVKDGEVMLSGHVENREGKHRAERLVEDVLGVGHVQNNLRVNPDAGLRSAGRGYGSSALEAEMRRNAEAANPKNAGASRQSGRIRSGGTATSVDPKTGAKLQR
jgi:hypothetical protein